MAELAQASEPVREPTGPEVVGTLIGIGFCHYCVTGWKLAQLAGKDLPVVAAAITMVPAAAPIPDPSGQIIGMTAVPLPACFDHVPVGRPAHRSLLVAAGGM